MQASISFNAYKDFSKYFELEHPYYAALEELNKMLEDLVAKDELVFTYKGKRVKIYLPLTIDDVGNIFSESLGDNETFWNDVQITCKLRCKEINFDASELQAEEYPDWLDPTHIYY